MDLSFSHSQKATEPMETKFDGRLIFANSWQNSKAEVWMLFNDSGRFTVTSLSQAEKVLSLIVVIPSGIVMDVSWVS